TNGLTDGLLKPRPLPRADGLPVRRPPVPLRPPGVPVARRRPVRRLRRLLRLRAPRRRPEAQVGGRLALVLSRPRRQLPPDRHHDDPPRRERAHGAYTTFEREFEALRRTLPLGLAIVGRAYRNEISPRQGTYRMREFLQAELQIFFDPETADAEFPPGSIPADPIRVALAAEKHEPSARDRAPADLIARGLPAFYVHHLALVQRFYLDRAQVPRERFRFAELDERERAFYNK